MKKIFFSTVISLFSFSMLAQLTDTGTNVGIGTTQPSDQLHVFKRGLANNQVHDVMRIQANTDGNRQSGFGVRINFSLNKYGNVANGTSSSLGAISVYDANNESSYGTMAFATKEKHDKELENKMWLDRFGNLGIGTDTPDSKLTVAGNVHSREVKVSIEAGADFVFEKSYNLRPLETIENFIKENHHLPEIASEKEMLENGLELGSMNIKLLQKVEELTLYLIDQNKQLQLQNKKIEELKKELITLKNK